MLRTWVTLAASCLLSACVGTTALQSAAASDLRPGAHFREHGDLPEMVVIPPGRFIMGSPSTEAGRDPDEGPQREISFPKAFAVGRLAVTRREYAAFVRATNRPDASICYADRNHAGTWKIEPETSWRDPAYKQAPLDPVVCVNLEDIQAYIAWINARTSGGYRMISEAEFEYSARAGAETRYPWGDAIGHDHANLGADSCCHGKAEGRDRWINTSPGGAFGANAFGLSDMQGNVWEFVADCYTPPLEAIPADGHAVVTTPCDNRVLRGAGWDDPPAYLRSANRYKQLSALRGSVTGFRLAKTLN